MFDFGSKQSRAAEDAGRSTVDRPPGLFARLRARLNRGDSVLTRDIRELLPGRDIDAELLDELETRLLSADVGVDATERILGELRRSVARHELKDIDALQTARSRGTDVLIADTAGRLHTQSGLMDELSKIRRVLAKLDTEAPHEVLLVIDGTTGQNAISQTRQFREAIGVTGLVVTKLDGTAKGGIVFALAREFGLPIRYVGLGESADDLRVFDATAFVDGLLPAKLGDG